MNTQNRDRLMVATVNVAPFVQNSVHLEWVHIDTDQ
jgi:hypothetical protein